MFAAIAIAIVAIIAAIIVITSKPKQNISNYPANSEIDAPQNSNGAVIPELFGTCKISGNIIWYGNLRSKAIWSD